ncbi:hypothetical protein QFZ53_002820 [Microbacterium natoriense]|uniref:Uncharacterized protein n=1 Tax=Microbacterium natoriense TaxID=284570 RepID=A0AAW8F0G6_9MICO|nr:hypothetical protein [Microbacterium natoriense]MDQ0648624.1 hypothetical protein [Microbacterium natoriense]
MPSESGLTNSGRLIDLDNIPEPLRPFVDADPRVVIVRDGVLYFADHLDITFNRINPAHDLSEVLRQVGLQQQSMRQLTAGDWDANIERFETDGRLDTQVGYRDAWVSARSQALQNEGLSPQDAIAAAKAELDGQVGLHGPDQF